MAETDSPYYVWFGTGKETGRVGVKNLWCPQGCLPKNTAGIKQSRGYEKHRNNKVLYLRVLDFVGWEKIVVGDLFEG